MEQLTFSVVIPVWNGRDHLAECLRALAVSTRRPDEIIVVDDSSDDESAAIAQAYGCKVVRLTNGPLGPATARNRGVSVSNGEIIVFVDCDVTVHRETLGCMELQFLADPDLSAVFGSYDDKPTAPGVVSRYRNLLHHHVHQQSRRQASTFWAGCGAIRREAFQAENGFDETYRWASIEDIELGLRLNRRGHRIALCREIQSTHRKRWTFREVIYTDIFRRAVPWTKLLLGQGELPNDLNLRIENRLSALAVWILFVLLILGMPDHRFWNAVPISLGVLLVCNLGLYRLFFRRGGFLFSLGAIALHWLHYFYSSATFAILALENLVRVHRSTAQTCPAVAERTVASGEVYF